MAEKKRTSRAAPARAADAESTETATPDETTGLSLLVAAGALGAFILLGSAAPHGQGAIEVTEQTHGDVAQPVEHSVDAAAPTVTESDAPTVKLTELAVEDSPAPEPEAVVAGEPEPPGTEAEPASEGVAVPKIVLEEEPAAAAPAPAAPAAPAPAAPAAPVAPATKPAAPAPKAPVAAAPAPPPQPVVPSAPPKPPAKPEAPAAPKAPALPPAPTLAPPTSNPY